MAVQNDFGQFYKIWLLGSFDGVIKQLHYRVPLLVHFE